MTVLTRIPAPPPSSARQRARCSSAAFADEYAAAFLPATSAFLEAMKTIEPPTSCSLEDLERFARDEEVAGAEDRVVAVPLLERRLLERGAGRDAGVGDDDVEAAERVDRGGERRRDVLLGRDVAADRDPVVLGHRVARSGLVEVERDHAGARGGERVEDRAADAAGAAGDERDLALELAGRRRLGELVELERPVLDREALGGVERDELAERLGAGHDLDRAVVEVARDLRRLHGRARGDHAHALDEDDPGVGIAGLVAVGVGLEVRPVVVAVGLRELGDAVRLLARDPQRQPLRVHEVVGARGADGDELRGLLGADELHHAVGGVDGEDLRALGGHRAADRRQQVVQRAVRLELARRRSGRHRPCAR